MSLCFDENLRITNETLAINNFPHCAIVPLQSGEKGINAQWLFLEIFVQKVSEITQF